MSLIESETESFPYPPNDEPTAAQAWNAQRLNHALRRYRHVLDLASGDQALRAQARDRVPAELWRDMSDSAPKRLQQGLITAITSLISSLAYDIEFDSSTGEERRADNPVGRDLVRGILNKHGWGPEGPLPR